MIKKNIYLYVFVILWTSKKINISFKIPFLERFLKISLIRYILLKIFFLLYLYDINGIYCVQINILGIIFLLNIKKMQWSHNDTSFRDNFPQACLWIFIDESYLSNFWVPVGTYICKMQVKLFEHIHMMLLKR